MGFTDCCTPCGERRPQSMSAAIVRAPRMELMNMLQAKLEAQSRLLEEAKREVFQLETRIKETAHKVDRLRDYEKRIAQLTTTQQLW
jgi:sigma54-dependent transcription regulator